MAGDELVNQITDLLLGIDDFCPDALYSILRGYGTVSRTTRL